MNNIMEVKFSAKSENESLARVIVASFAAKLDPTLDELADIKTAVSEAVTNSIIHGYDEDDSKFVYLRCEINENTIKNYLDTKSIPDPDLIIRTSGEQRLSNFLMWEAAYCEFYFTDIHWPDFNRIELQKAIYVYQNRDRRFGGLSK